MESDDKVPRGPSAVQPSGPEFRKLLERCVRSFSRAEADAGELRTVALAGFGRGPVLEQTDIEELQTLGNLLRRWKESCAGAILIRIKGEKQP